MIITIENKGNEIIYIGNNYTSEYLILRPREKLDMDLLPLTIYKKTPHCLNKNNDRGKIMTDAYVRICRGDEIVTVEIDQLDDSDLDEMEVKYPSQGWKWAKFLFKWIKNIKNLKDEIFKLSEFLLDKFRDEIDNRNDDETVVDIAIRLLSEKK